MQMAIFRMLGERLRHERRARGLTQPDLAARLGRDRARISEIERDLLNNRLGRDRLTLFAEICDALDLAPVLVPRGRLGEIQALLQPAAGPRPGDTVGSVFDDVFVDLSEGEEE